MSKPVLLWFDCSPSVKLPELQQQLARFFTVVRSTCLDHAAQDIQRVRPRVLCFDFDYPDQSRLRAMQVVKRDYMALPVLMFTLEHSEALAVWAFRARVWNYLVKPVPATELEDNLRALVMIAATPRRGTCAYTLRQIEVPHEVPASRSADPRAQVLPGLSYLERHFNEHVSEAELTRLCGISPCHFSRLFRAAFGITFREYLVRYRIAEACRLLERPSVSLADVGYAVGFNDASYFSRAFRRCCGTTPSEYHSSHGRQAMLPPTSASRRSVRAGYEELRLSEPTGVAAGDAVTF